MKQEQKPPPRRCMSIDELIAYLDDAKDDDLVGYMLNWPTPYS